MVLGLNQPCWQDGAVRNTNILFLCSRNRRRSPTAERVFADHMDTELIEQLERKMARYV